MTVNDKNVVSWFNNRKGKLTYSMYGSRNGADGTADCSGSITQSIFEAGAAKYAYLYSTVTLANYLQANGYTCISRNQDWDAKGGEVVLMSWGADMSTSGGAGGHVGVMKDANTFISVDYWTGGQVGTAVSEHIWNDYYATNKPTYVEVWRNIKTSEETASNGSGSTNTNNTTTTANIADYQKEEDYMKIVQAINSKKEKTKLYLVTAQGARWIKTTDDEKNIDRMYAGVGKKLPRDTAYESEIKSLNRGFNSTDGF